MSCSSCFCSIYVIKAATRLLLITAFLKGGCEGCNNFFANCSYGRFAQEHVTVFCVCVIYVVRAATRLLLITAFLTEAWRLQIVTAYSGGKSAWRNMLYSLYLLSIHLERCPSGLRSMIGNHVCGDTVPRVQIPLSPPKFKSVYALHRRFYCIYW